MLMTNFRLITNIFFAALFGVAACSTTTAKLRYVVTIHSDTIYSVSTLQLKSDKIPDSVFQMTNLRHLAINGMDCDYGDRKNCWMITEIPSGIKNLRKLTSLRLTLSVITTIPNDLTELINLTLIDLTDNIALTDIYNLTKLKNLQYLYLYGCGLTKLPDDIGDLTKLKELGLVGNRIDKAERTRIKNALPKCAIEF
jgi:hypothetical protein